MTLFFQMLGITGLVMMLSGLLAFSVTQLADLFFWFLVAGGAFMVVAFVVTSLARQWQALVGAFVTVNLSWILLLIGKNWPLWGQSLAILGCIAAYAACTFPQANLKTVALMALLIAGIDGGLIYFRDATWFGYGVLGAAFVLNGVFIQVARGILKDLFEKRSLRYGSMDLVYTFFVFAIIVVANAMSQDFHYQKDLTQDQVFTLTDQSEKLVKGLTSKLIILAFFDERNQAKAQAKDLLNMYRMKSKNVEVQFVDPDKDRELAIKHNAKDGDMVIELNGQTNVTKELTEEGITKAILKVTRDKQWVVCFTKGHGEMEIDASEEEPRSLSAIKGGLENEGYQPKAVDSLVGGVPADCSALIIAGPTQMLTVEEADSVDKFLAGGGKGLFLLDPQVPDPRLKVKDYRVLPTGLEKSLHAWGVEIGSNFILEKHLNLFQGVRTELRVIAQTYGNHPIVDPIKKTQTVFENVRSVRKAAGFSGTVTELVSSAGAAQSWAESNVDLLYHQHKADVDGNDIPGPVPLAVASEKLGEKPTRLVVFGDSDFASNAGARSQESNFDLFLNSLNWLQGETDQISIRPKRIRTSTIELTAEQSKTIFYVAIIGIPMLVLIFGLDLWWFRRRRG